MPQREVQKGRLSGKDQARSFDHGILRELCFGYLELPQRMMDFASINATCRRGVQTIPLGEKMLQRSLRRVEGLTLASISSLKNSRRRS